MLTIGKLQHQSHRDRLAQGAAEAEDRGADDARAARRQHRHPDHLPLGGAERECGFLLRGVGLDEDLADDRRDDRQDHDREHDADDERRAGRQAGVPVLEDRDPRQVAEDLLDALQVGHQAEQPPQAVHDARNRGEQVEQVAHAAGDPARGVLRDEQGHRHARPATR